VQHRRTKILATIGPASRDPRVLARMVAAGVDAIRINASHGLPEEWRADAGTVRRSADIAGRPIALVFDLCGPKIRLDPTTDPREFAEGDTVDFAGGEQSDNGAIVVRWPALAEAVTAGRSEIVVGDGTPRFEVLDVAGTLVRARCQRRGWIGPSKGVFVTNAGTAGPPLTEKDLHDLDVATEVGVDFVAQSFVRSAEDVAALRAELEARQSRARVIAKIEKADALDVLDDVIAIADGVMVARGDLGIELGAARVPLAQKEIIHRATAAGKLVITATQMLESMIHSPEPTRAEASDVTNAILDGTSALMLSGETAIGDYPAEAVRAMAEIAAEAQAASPFALDIDAQPSDQAEAVVQSATHLAAQIDAAALVIPTTSGGSVRAAAKYRPSRPIVALAHDEVVMNQLALEWGVIAGTLPAHGGRIEELIDEALWSARALAHLRNGDTVVVTYGRSARISGGTDLVAVRRIGAGTPPGYTDVVDPVFG
jgi:pyruvate kinase